MPLINYAFKEITCKIVYYGPGAGGKTTNLHYVHSNVPAKHRGEMVSLATEQDRTLFFDFLPLDIGDVKGFKTKFQLYTVPGQVYYNQTRKLVLRGVDAIVFVADSSESRLQDSIDSLRNLEDNLRELNLSLDGMPFVMQYNKRDLPDAVKMDVLRKSLNPQGRFVEYESVATEGTGCRESLRDVASQLLKKLNSTQNIITDEAVVTERLGVAGAVGMPAVAPSLSDQQAPEIRVMQSSVFQWRGFGVGSGEVTVRSQQNDRGETVYDLATEHKVLGSRRTLKRSMRFVGEDKRTINGVDRTLVVLRDASAGRGSAPVAAFVEKGKGMDRVYLVYPGIAGEMKVGPEGEDIIV